MKQKFRLTIELVPSTAWYKSLYNILPRKEWLKLKKDVHAREGRRCYICGSSSRRLELHEFWEYDDEHRIQRLKEEFLEHEQEAFRIWKERSQHEWKQDFGEYEKYLKQ